MEATSGEDDLELSSQEREKGFFLDCLEWGDKEDQQVG